MIQEGILNNVVMTLLSKIKQPMGKRFSYSPNWTDSVSFC